MNNFDRHLAELLIDLKENHNVIAVKTEFETEGTSLFEAEKLCNIVKYTNLKFTTKIGGSGALNDIINAKKLNSDTIVAPMIESSYALKKFVETIKLVYTEEEIKNIQLLINIETITGLNNLKDIINSEEFNYIDGIVLGRNDLVSSMNLDKNQVNSNNILYIANDIAKEMGNKNKLLIIGGCVDESSIDFFNKINSKAFIGFETRKIVFKNTNNIKRESILKAIEFEINWLRNKEEKNNIDINRINHLEKIFVK